ncbi:MAG TPA: D-aminoacylase [Nitrospirae bacterium]|nr:D-aminoacylase [bacterium BMS3Abin06]HDH11124.1 D-aminoacylase [Nitrospirota bacterium]HDZ02525.1 D-aminoacylase [Nitrospirota bacterium]
MSIDYLLKDGFVIDGSADDTLPKKADIAIEGDCIKEIGNFSHARANKTINLNGLVVCPGFIDVHAHSEFLLLADGRAQGKISQGITTEINGNCGLSAAPLFGPALEQREHELDEMDIKERWRTFSEYFRLLEKRKFAPNFITLAGHGNLRASVAGYADKPLSKTDMEKITGLLGTAMSEGAKGISTGLVYPPGVYSETSEIIDLAREAARHNGIYATHMRSEGDNLLESVDEVIEIARESKIHAHISHLKTSGEKNWKKLRSVFDRIEQAHGEGLSITCDRYPYTASSTDLDIILPSWAFEGGYKKEIARLKTQRERLADDILKDYPKASCWDNIIISSAGQGRNKWMQGKSISDISKSLNKTSLTSLFDLLIEENLDVGAIFFLMNEENLKSILKRPYTVIGTDSAARSFDGITAKGMPHPRGFGAFPRVLGRYVREQGIILLSEAIYKMTGLPAKIFRINNRGIIKKGFFADITVFDPEKVNGAADFSNPFQKPEGIYHVFINGIPVLLDGGITGALPGRILK